MNKIPDLPPRENEAPPVVSSYVLDALAKIGSLDGKPFFRAVWGQDGRYRKFWREDWYLPYRDHVRREYALGEPRYDLVGQMIGYERIFKRGDVMPADVSVLAPVMLSTEIGIPRYFIELLEYYDGDAWESQRHTDETGAVLEKPDGTLMDFMGPYPEGGLDYSRLWLCAEHKGCCDAVSPTSNIGYQVDGEQCFGFRRLPNMSDVQEMRSRWRQFEKAVNRSDLRDASATSAEINRSVKARIEAINAYWDKVRQDIDDDIYQQITPHGKRLTSEGSGPDLEKYHFLKGKTTARDNQHKASE